MSEIYQELIIDHARHPHNFRRVDGATCVMTAHNPLCGDQLTLSLTLDGETISDIGFEGSGCAISTASASLMTVAMKGLDRAQALDLFEQVHDLLTVEPEPGAPEPDIGKLNALAGVREYPTRVKCASLAWQTLRSALVGERETVRTE